MKPLTTHSETNQAGIDLIKEFEGCKLEAYKCPAGIWTIGYGHTGNDVHSGMVISQEQANDLLHSDLKRFEKGVEEAVTVPLNGNQFAALVSFSFNLGIGALLKSTLLRLLNQGCFKEAAEEFNKWSRSNGQVLPGLVRRREAEQQLFMEPV